MIDTVQEKRDPRLGLLVLFAYGFGMACGIVLALLFAHFW